LALWEVNWMKDEDKTKVELIKELKLLREDRKKVAFKNITEHKQAEEHVLAAQNRLAEIMESITDGFVAFDTEMNYTFLNTRGAELLGCKPADLVGKNYWTEFPEAKGTLFANAYLRALETRTPIIFEDYYEPWDRWFENRIYPTPEGIAIYFTETTVRKQAEEKEKEHHKNIELLSESAMQFVEFPQNKDIYIFIGEKLKEFTGENTIIMVNSIDTEKDILVTRSVFGLGKLSDTVSGLLGKYPVGTIYNAKDESLSYLSDGKLHLYKEGLYGISLKTIPKTVCNSLEKLFNVKRIYTIGFTKENKLFGTAVIFFKEDAGEFKNKQTIETFIKQASIAIQRRQAEERLKNTLDAAIETMSKIIEVKDPYTAGHQQRVSQLTTAISKELNFSPDKIEGIRIASLIHDIGKISVPTEILSKTTTLSDIEFSLIKGHSQAGSDILKAIDFSYPVANIVLQHHERLDGSGYPQGLKSDEILPEARIIGVADVVEAMSSHRPYRPSLGIDAALEEISQNRGILYDPEVVDICLRLFKEKGFKLE